MRLAIQTFLYVANGVFDLKEVSRKTLQSQTIYIFPNVKLKICHCVTYSLILFEYLSSYL